MMRATARMRCHLLTLAVAAGLAWPAQAQPPAGDVDRGELAVRFEAEMQRLKAMGPAAEDFANELQKQYDAYVHDAKAHEDVLRETQARIAQAREAFDRYYQQLIAEGQTEGAERMKKLFEISLMGAPMAAAPTPTTTNGSPAAPTPQPMAPPAAPALDTSSPPAI